MIVNKSDALVEDYLDELEKELAGLAPRERRELVEDLTEHIRSERAELETDSEAGVRQILDRLGSPATVAAAARAESPAPAPVAAPAPAPAGWNLTRILLIVLGVLITVVVLFMVFFAPNSVSGGPVPTGNTSVHVG